MSKETPVLFGAQWCGYCRTLQKHLDTQNIAYEYKDVEIKENEEKMLSLTDGKYLIPTLIVDGKAYQNPQPNSVKELVG